METRPDPGHPLATRGIEQFVDRFEAFYSAGLDGNRTGLAITALSWGADAELRLIDPAQTDIPIAQTFTHPRSGKTLLHGHRVETEGVRLHLNGGNLTDFIQAEVERLRDHPEGRWHRGQIFRYLIGSGARAAGTTPTRPIALPTCYSAPPAGRTCAIDYADWSEAGTP